VISRSAYSHTVRPLLFKLMDLRSALADLRGPADFRWMIMGRLVVGRATAVGDANLSSLISAVQVSGLRTTTPFIS